MKEKILFINCCIRRENSRTLKIAKAFINALDKNKYEVEELCLMDEPLVYFKEGFFEQRESLIAENNLKHPRFRYAWQFKEADKIIVAAPFWDLSFPALLKVYIENLCVDGITFGADENGCYGTCKAEKLMYITTRGGIYKDSPLEMGIRYIEAMSKFFGIDRFESISAEGIDMYPDDAERIVSESIENAVKLAAEF